MKKQLIVAAAVAMLLSAAISTTPANAQTSYMSGHGDCTSVQRHVMATGTAKSYVIVTAGKDVQSGNAYHTQDVTRTAYSGEYSASWSIKGTPSILSGHEGCSIL
jgi:opacity protein-like surface antigen